MKSIVKSVMAVMDPAFWIRAARAGWSDAMRRRLIAIGVTHPFGPVRVERALDQIPVVEMSVIAASAAVISLDVRLAFRDGAAPPADLLALTILASMQKPLGVLEIGTFDGSTARNLALTLPDAQIHTIDLPPVDSTASTAALKMDDLHLVEKRRVGEAYVSTPEAARITQHFGDSATYDFSQIADALTFFYIDGAHTYEYIRSDTIRSMEVAHGTSTFVWHDVNFTHEGVVAWIAQLATSGIAVRRVAGTNIGYLQCTPTAELVAKLRALPQRPTV